MTKEKLPYLFFNLFWGLPTLGVVFYFTYMLVELDLFWSIGIALFTYLIDVMHSTNIDYLNHRIDELEKNIK